MYLGSVPPTNGWAKRPMTYIGIKVRRVGQVTTTGQGRPLFDVYESELQTLTTLEATTRLRQIRSLTGRHKLNKNRD